MIQEFEKIRVLIAYDGTVHWEPGGVFIALRRRVNLSDKNHQCLVYSTA